MTSNEVESLKQRMKDDEERIQKRTERRGLVIISGVCAAGAP